MRRIVWVFALAAGIGAAGGAAAPARQTEAARTLVSTSTPIRAFAQDGSRVAWSTTGRGCVLRVHLLSAATHRRVDLGATRDSIGCAGYGGLALAGDRALWTLITGAGNTELDVGVYTARIGSPVARQVRSMAMVRPEYGPEPRMPPVAGRGGMLVYYRHEDGIGGPPVHAVEQALGTRPRRVFRSEDPVALAVDHGRIAVARQVLQRGDACNCNFDPAWSPDGTKVAFISGDECCVDDSEKADVYVMNVDGTGRTRLTTDETPKLGVSWSPDGSRLAFGYYDSHFALKLAVMTADGSGRHDVASGENPAWSPDGTMLAYDDRQHVFVAGADGSNPRQLVAGAQPAWSPDGTRLAYSADAALYTIQADGTNARRLATDIGEPAWSPDGTAIAGSGDKGITLVRADGSSSMVVPGSERGDADPSWSPDGAQLVFDSLRNELVPDGYARPEIYVADFDGVNLHPITYSTPDQLYTDVQIRSNYGRLIKSLLVLGDPIGVALDGRILAVLTHPAHRQADELYVYRDGLLAHLTVPGTSSSLAASGGRIVFADGNTIRLVEPRTGTIRLLAFTRGELIGIGISGRRVTWAENVRKRGLIRTLVLR